MTEQYMLKEEDKVFLEELNKRSKLNTPIRCKNETPAQSLYYEVENNEIVDLNLDHSRITELPKSIGNLLSLRTLSLVGNNMTSLPKSIKNLKALRTLILRSNSMEDLPVSITYLSSLEKLDLEGNKLSNLPDSIGNLTSLKELQIKSNNLTSLPKSIGKLSSLQTLQLESNKLTALPKSIGNLSSLKELYLKRNFITSLPNSIENLRSLQILDLEGSKLGTLLDSIGNLTSLQKLNLMSTNLESLPDSIGNLVLLEVLEVGRNKIKHLPDTLSKLKNLKFLYLAENQIEIIPEWIGEFKLLENLNLASNKLSSLPRTIGNLTNLISLNLFKNNFSSFPVVIWPLKNLERLELRNNLWDQELKEIVEQDIEAILKYCRKYAAMNVFLSHAVANYDYFKIKELSDYFEEQNEIYNAYYCEEDLKGNIDDFMNDKVPDSQLLLFFASEKSVLNSVDCAHELALARQNDIQIIPIKGADISWEDLGEIRSLAVVEESQKEGLGSRLVEACLSEAIELGLSRIFVLTLIKGFFARFGFKEVEKSLLPHKIWADCVKCPKFPDCDEIAMILEL